jgi:hypothetical protein
LRKLHNFRKLQLPQLSQLRGEVLHKLQIPQMSQMSLLQWISANANADAITPPAFQWHSGRNLCQYLLSTQH